jgi:hypothetical protein
MTFTANLGAERPSSPTEASPGSGFAADRYAQDRGNSAQPGEHDPQAKDLLERYLSEIHSYRELGNVALRQLERRLEALSEHEEPFDAAEEMRKADAASPRRHSLQQSALGEAKGGNLNDRLRELSAYLHADLTKQDGPRGPLRSEADQEQSFEPAPPATRPWYAEAAGDAGQAPRPAAAPKPTPNAPILDRAWFEDRFAVMRGSIDQLAEKIPTRRLETLETQFQQLMERLDARETGKSMAAVEAGLKKLAAYLEDNKHWSAAQDARMNGVEERLDRLSGLVAQSHAALSATAKGLEIVARGTGANLAHNTADLVARKLETQLAMLDQSEPIAMLSGEVSDIANQSRQFARSTDERLKQLQNCLDESLDRIDCLDAKAEAPRSEKRRPAETDDDSFDDSYDGRMIAAARRAARLADGSAHDMPQDGEPVRYQIPYGEFLPAEERQNSRIGLVVAAVILLLASAAMLYLNLRDKGRGASLSSAWLSYVLPERDAGNTGNTELTTASVRTQIINPDAPESKTSGRLNGSDWSLSVSPRPGKAPAPGAHATAAAEPVEPAGDSTGGDTLPFVDEGKTDSLRSAAVAGDADAQFSIGETYLQGQNIDYKLPVAERLSKAARWFRRAAEKGHVPSQYRLATLYELGHGAPKDLAEAMVWYRRAAENGHVKAMHNLAVLSVIGDRRSANYLTAANWFSKAAEHGLKDSQFNLGVLYERGLGVSKDPAQAYRWFALAAKQGDDKAAGKRDLLAAELTAEELSAQGREMTAWTALEFDTEANSKAPEPPVEPASRRQAAVKPRTPAPQPIKAAWSTQLTTIDEIAAEGQRLLLKLGYSVGQVDGIVGPRTAAAIRAFEQKIGAPATGRLTEALVAKMAFAL